MTSESAEFERLRQRAVAIGEGDELGAAAELVSLLDSPSPRVRRAVASAMGKLAERHQGLHRQFATTLYLKALDETGDQVREYMLKALARCASAMTGTMVKELRDLARNPMLKPYVRNAANEAVAAGETAIRAKAAAVQRQCVRCHAIISPEEAEAGLVKYGKAYCRHCFDERTLEDVSFEKTVEGAKRLRTVDLVAVQSQGEKRIGDWLAAMRIRYIYDERYRIVADAALRPDFYLPEFDIYIEYWGMETKDYLERKREKQFLYQRAAKRLISLGPEDLPRIEEVLEEKLSRYITLPKDSDRCAALRPSEVQRSDGAARASATAALRPSEGVESNVEAAAPGSSFLPDGTEIRPHPAPRPSLWLGW